MKTIHKLTLAVAAAAMTACGSIPKRTYVFDAIDANEDPRACMIVVDQDWVAAAQNNQFVNLTANDELPLELTFKDRIVQITAVAIRTLDGKPVSVPRNPREAVEVSEYVLRKRDVLLRDAERQLFIFERK